MFIKNIYKLCCFQLLFWYIVVGIYPHEPRHPKKAGKGSTAPKTYYFCKDIQFLLHEPIVGKFREFKVFVRKLKKALGKGDRNRAARLRENKPKYKLEHIVKERYPTFIDALRDINDCLSMCFLFATFPKTRKTHVEQIELCRRLTVEFMHFIIASKCLKKVFISIKGVYYQVEICGQTITWVTPHKLGYEHPTDVDYRIMSTFVEFYVIMLGFVNFKLYSSIGLHYPPQLIIEKNINDEEDMTATEREEKLAGLNQSLQSAMQDLDMIPDTFAPDGDERGEMERIRLEEEESKKLQSLFSGLKFFVNREAPREALTFIVRSCGGEVSWNKTVAAGFTYHEDDETITHQIVDRPKVEHKFVTRSYIQPQWVFDSINTRRLLPVDDYLPGAVLPPHLSPF